MKARNLYPIIKAYCVDCGVLLADSAHRNKAKRCKRCSGLHVWANRDKNK